MAAVRSRVEPLSPIVSEAFTLFVVGRKHVFDVSKPLRQLFYSGALARRRDIYSAASAPKFSEV